MTRLATNHKHTALRKIITKRLKAKQSFILGCSLTSVGYWFNILSMHFSHAKIEKCEEGLKIS